MTYSLSLRLGFLAAGLAAIAAAVPGVSAQEKRPMTIVDLIDVPRVGSPRLSPDGTELLYTRSDTDWKKNGRTTHIHRIATDGTGDVRLTGGERGESSPRWSPDGAWDRISGPAGESPFTQIHRMSNRGGEATPLTEHESSVQSYAFSPDGEHIYFIAPDPKTPEEKKQDDLRDDMFAFDEDYKQRHLFRVPTSGKAPGMRNELPRGIFRFSSSSFQMTGCGSPIRGADPASRQPRRGRGLGHGHRWRKRPPVDRQHGDRERRPAFSRRLPGPLRVGVQRRLRDLLQRNVFLIPAAGGPHRVLYADWPHEANGATWAPDGSIYFIGNTGVRSQLFHAAVDDNAPGRSPTVTTRSRDGTLRPPPVSTSSGSATARTTATFTCCPAEGGEPTKVTSVFDTLDETFELPIQEAVRWQGEDGVEVEGLLYYPLDYQEGQRYPLVVQTHGGPRSSDKFSFGRWGSYVPVLTARGYAVFKPNYRGSTGYGDDFLRDMVGHYFNQAHLDVMAGVDYLIERGIADGDRMAKMGWSAGGHMTNKIITHTGRFKAASSGAGAVNWISMYGQSDVRHPRTPWFGGTPWEEDAPIDAYWGNSPLKDIYKVTTPTIVIVGENDVRVPMPQSVELYRALRTNGVDTHLYVAPREPHGLRELRHQLFKVNVEIDWFERHVRGMEYEWETAPGEDEEKKAATDGEQQ